MPKFKRFLRASLLVKILTLTLLLTALLYFIDITLVPIFSDEAVFLYEADKITENLGNLFISFEQDQFPIMTWILAAIHFLFPSTNQLLSGRLLSVFADLLSTFLIFLIGSRIGNKLSGLLAALIYLALPLNFFHSRLVFLEPLTIFFALVTVYLVILACEKEQFALKYSSLIFIFSLLAFFTKPLAVVTILPSLFIPLMFALKDGSFKINLRRLYYFYRNVFIGIVPAVAVIVMIFALWPDQTLRVLAIHINQPTQALNLAFPTFKLNLWKSLFWARAYITDPILFFSFAVIIFGLWKRRWKVFWLALWALFTVIIKSYFIKFYYPRHLFSLTAPIALITAYGLAYLFQSKKWLGIFILMLLLLLPVRRELGLISNPKTVLVGEEKQVFYEDWPSGVGLDSLAQKLKLLSENKTIEVYVENEPLTAWALPNLFDVGRTKIYPNNDLLSTNREFFYTMLKNRKSEDDIYLVLNHYPYLPNHSKFQLIYSYPKGPNRSLNLYKFVKD